MLLCLFLLFETVFDKGLKNEYEKKNEIKVAISLFLTLYMSAKNPKLIIDKMSTLNSSSQPFL